MNRKAALFLTVLALSCTPAPPDARDASAAPASSSPRAAPAPAESDSGRIARLEREARALAHAEGCSAGACRTAPVGSRPCGGPRTYLVYCAASTDSAALFAKLAELARAEEAYNSANGLASTCEYRMPPNVSVRGGRCVASEPNAIPVQ